MNALEGCRGVGVGGGGGGGAEGQGGRRGRHSLPQGITL